MKNMDWLPLKRKEQLEMGKNWEKILAVKLVDWKVPPDAATKLTNAVAVANTEISVPPSERNPVANTRLKVAFKTLTAEMRDIKRRYFFVPPLTEADVVALGLKPKDTVYTVVGDPVGQATADVAYLGGQTLQFNIKHIVGTPFDAKANYGKKLYFDIADVNDPPIMSGENLSKNVFTRRKKETITFAPADAKKVAYFCIRYENSKGKAGPWGPVFSAIIP
jgi:hypothetical protein